MSLNKNVLSERKEKLLQKRDAVKIDLLVKKHFEILKEAKRECGWFVKDNALHVSRTANGYAVKLEKEITDQEIQKEIEKDLKRKITSSWCLLIFLNIPFCILAIVGLNNLGQTEIIALVFLIAIFVQLFGGTIQISNLWESYRNRQALRS